MAAILFFTRCTVLLMFVNYGYIQAEILTRFEQGGEQDE